MSCAPSVMRFPTKDRSAVAGLYAGITIETFTGLSIPRNRNKLGVESRAQAASLFVQHNLTQLALVGALSYSEWFQEGGSEKIEGCWYDCAYGNGHRCRPE